jgi:hypothetical protein
VEETDQLRGGGDRSLRRWRRQMKAEETDQLGGGGDRSVRRRRRQIS